MYVPLGVIAKYVHIGQCNSKMLRVPLFALSPSPVVIVNTIQLSRMVQVE